MSKTNAAYRSDEGKIQWLAQATRPDLAFAGSVLSSYLCEDEGVQFAWMKRALRWASLTKDRGLFFPNAGGGVRLTVHADASWGARANNSRSVTGYVIGAEFDNAQGVMTALAWNACVQTLVATSSASAEIVAAHTAVEKMSWLSHLLECIGVEVTSRGLLSDAMDLLDMLGNKRRLRSKEWAVAIRMARLRELVDQYGIDVVFVPGSDNAADELTKATPSDRIPKLFLYEKHDRSKKQVNRAGKEDFVGMALPILRKKKGVIPIKTKGAMYRVDGHVWSAMWSEKSRNVLCAET